jgi:hypothetical protein
MSVYNYSVVLTVSPANGQGPVPAEVEAEKVAEFVRRLANLGAEFGVGKLEVTVVPMET